jgi:hypothetical protein
MGLAAGRGDLRSGGAAGSETRAARGGLLAAGRGDLRSGGVAWTHANIGKYGGDPHRLFLVNGERGGPNCQEVVQASRFSLSKVGTPGSGRGKSFRS